MLHLDWLSLALVYPLLMAILPASSAPPLTATILARCINDTLLSGRVRGYFKQQFKPGYINYRNLAKVIAQHPSALLHHYLDFKRYTSRDHDPYILPPDKYLSCIFAFSIQSTPRFWNRQELGLRKKRIMSIVFHPKELVVALVFVDSGLASFGVYDISGPGASSTGQLIYFYPGAIEGRTLTDCKCDYLAKFNQLSWSPNGDLLACIEDSDIEIGNTAAVTFFVYFHKPKPSMRRIGQNGRRFYCGPVNTRGFHRLNNMTLWASDNAFMAINFDSVFSEAPEISIKPMRISMSENRESAEVKICKRIAIRPFGERAGIFAYNTKKIKKRTTCDNMGDSRDITYREYPIPTGLWLVDDVIIISEDCPNLQHEPHSIIQRYPLFERNNFGNRSYAFDNERVHDAAVHLDHPKQLLVLLSRNYSSNPPWMQSGANKDWNNEMYEPVSPTCEPLQNLPPDVHCLWGCPSNPRKRSANVVEMVYLGTIDNEREGTFKQISMGSISIYENVGYSHQFQLQILAQTSRYVMIRECCNKNAPKSNADSLSSTSSSSRNSYPLGRIFLFSKIANQCVEISDPYYLPHPANDLLLYFNLKSEDPLDSQAIVVLRSFYPVAYQENRQKHKNMMDLNYSLAISNFNSKQACRKCERRNYAYGNEYNMPVKSCLYYE